MGKENTIKGVRLQGEHARLGHEASFRQLDEDLAEDRCKVASKRLQHADDGAKELEKDAQEVEAETKTFKKKHNEFKDKLKTKVQDKSGNTATVEEVADVEVEKEIAKDKEL